MSQMTLNLILKCPCRLVFGIFRKPQKRIGPKRVHVFRNAFNLFQDALKGLMRYFGSKAASLFFKRRNARFQFFLDSLGIFSGIA